MEGLGVGLAETWELLCPGKVFFRPKNGTFIFLPNGIMIFRCFYGVLGMGGNNLGKAGCGAIVVFPNLGVPTFFEWELVFVVYVMCVF